MERERFWTLRSEEHDLGVRTVKQNWYMSWPLCLKTQTEQWPQRPLIFFFIFFIFF